MTLSWKERRKEDAGRVLNRDWLENDSYVYEILVKPPCQKYIPLSKIILVLNYFL